MSIEVELNGKGGRVCSLAQEGTIHCPCIVRSTSEDVVVGNVFGQLKHVRPHLWLGPLLNEALSTTTYSRVWYKDLRIQFWKRQTRFPPELLRFKEGRTEPDIIIEWENPPTTVWIEAKWLSPFAAGTSRCFHNDQVVRGVRTLLAYTGHVHEQALFQRSKRRPVWIALTLLADDPILERCHDEAALLRHVPRMNAHPKSPFVGTLCWRKVNRQLDAIVRDGIATERSIGESLSTYLRLKIDQARLPRFKCEVDSTAVPSLRRIHGR